MVRAIADGLSRNYPEHAAIFQKNAAAYIATLDEWIARWRREAAPLKGKKLVSYHPDLIYFAERFGMVPVRNDRDPSRDRSDALARRRPHRAHAPGARRDRRARAALPG